MVGNYVPPSKPDTWFEKHFIAILAGASALAVLSIALLSGVGKYQLCKNYFPEMTRAACFFTQLPAVVKRQ